MSDYEGLPVERETVDLPVVYSEAAAKLAEQLKARLGAPSGNKIRTTQSKKFRMPDGEETAGPIEVVIIDFTSKNEFYPNGFNPQDLSPPVCFAINQEPSLLTPSVNSPEKQSETCSSCPNNQWGTGARGNGKACKNQRVVAVMAPDALTTGGAIQTLTVSPTAIKGFDDYVRNLLSKKVLPGAIITEVGFDPTKDYPSLTFKAARPLGAGEFEGFAAKGEAAADLIAQEPDVSNYGKPAAAATGARRPARR